MSLHLMGSLFDKVIDRVLAHESGFTDDPRDPGNWTGGDVNSGELKGTKFGISAASLPDVDIRNLTREEAKDIYRHRYWDAVSDVSDAVRFQMLDAGVNHGTHRAIRLLQSAIGTRPDGLWGPASAAAARSMDNNDILLRFLGERLIFMTNCHIWETYGKGWARRIGTNLRFAAEDN